MRSFKRNDDELRPIDFRRQFTKHAEGSVLVISGETQVICNATIDETGTIQPKEEEVPVSMNTVNPASRLSNVNMVQPITDPGPMNPSTMARGQQLFGGPGEITFASKGGIMNSKKAFQRVA